MSIKQWYRADIQWAVMVEGKEGLREWKESVYLFQSENRDAAFQRRWRSADGIGIYMATTKADFGWRRAWHGSPCWRSWAAIPTRLKSTWGSGGQRSGCPSNTNLIPKGRSR